MSKSLSQPRESSQTFCGKLFLSQHFQMCKAKYQKRKFIQRQNREEIGLYKQKMLRLVRKKSSETVSEVEEKISLIEKQLPSPLDQNASFAQQIQKFESKVRNWNPAEECQLEKLMIECKEINSEIEALNKTDRLRILTVADLIQKICLQSISR